MYFFLKTIETQLLLLFILYKVHYDLIDLKKINFIKS